MASSPAHTLQLAEPKPKRWSTPKPESPRLSPPASPRSADNRQLERLVRAGCSADAQCCN